MMATAKAAKKSDEEVGSAFDLVGKSYNIVKKNWLAFAVTNIFGLVASVFAFKIDEETKKTNSFGGINSPFGDLGGWELGTAVGASILLLIIFLAINFYLSVMLTILEVESSKGKKPDLNHLFEKAKKYWLRVLGVTILSGLIIVVGLILLIIPGLFAIGRVIMAPYFLVDKDLGVMEALKASNEMGRKFPGKVWAAIGVMICVALGTAIVSAVPVIGQLLATIIAIVFSLVVVLRYQQLKKLHA